jgi:hypothetical protein
MDSSAQLKRARRTAMVLAAVSIIYVLATIYAWLQKIEAEKRAERFQKELEHCKQEKK